VKSRAVRVESETTPVRDFRELRVYRMAFDAAMQIYTLSKKWPLEERYSLTDADTEAGETLVWIDFAAHCGYLRETDSKELSERYDHICAQLVTMINQRDKWCS